MSGVTSQAVLNRSPVISQLVISSSAPKRSEMRSTSAMGSANRHWSSHSITTKLSPIPSRNLAGKFRRPLASMAQSYRPKNTLTASFCGIVWGALPTSLYFTPLIQVYCNKTGP